MPRVLIVSANFPPLNTPDMQRVRMSLPHFVDAGWEIVVLTVDDREPMAPLEPELLETIPAAVKVVRARAFSRHWSKWIGVNNLGLRTLPFLYATGCQLLRAEQFNLVYFSTTQFVLFPLGRLWRWEFDVPYVIDLQDPWLNDYYSQPGAPRPPGGWKYIFSNGTAKVLERWTMRRVAHVISVSERYLVTLQQRYPWFTAAQGTALTFGAPDIDFATARRIFASAPRLLPASNTFKIAYAGRLGADMLPALNHLFAAVARFKDAPRPFELFFYGTSYAPAGQAKSTTTTLAETHGIGALVQEKPARIGYIDSLRLLLEADLALVLGSEDKAYSPSKVYPTLMAGRPTLAVAPAGSVLVDKLQELGGAALVDFSGNGLDLDAVARLRQSLDEFTQHPGLNLGPPARLDLITRQYSAAAIAAQQLAIFNRLIRQAQPPATTGRLEEFWPDLPGATLEAKQ